MGPTKLEKPTEQKTTIGQKEEEEEEKKKKKKEEADRKEVGQSVEGKKEKEVPAKQWDKREINIKQCGFMLCPTDASASYENCNGEAVFTLSDIVVCF